MKQKVYIETTIPSFYYETRTEPEMVAMREWTQDWWNNQLHHYDLVTSIPVIEEIVEEYVTHYIMPNDPKGDALHLALASYHHCHFLLTWNCAHLANANKFEHIRHINTILGLYVPILTTPYELLYWEEK